MIRIRFEFTPISSNNGVWFGYKLQPGKTQSSSRTVKRSLLNRLEL